MNKDFQEEQRRMETDSGFPMRSYCCSIEWLTTALGRVCLEAPQ